MIGVLRSVLRLRRCVRPQFMLCAVVACCLTPAALLLLQLYRRQLTELTVASRRQIVGPTIAATSYSSRVSSALTAVVPRVTGLDDIFISIKTTGRNHDRRIALLQRTWLALAQNQVRSEFLLSRAKSRVQAFSVNWRFSAR